MLSRFSCVRLSVTPWTVAHQALLSMGFSRQEYWSGLPCASSGCIPDPGVEPTSLASLALVGGFFTTVPPGKPIYIYYYHILIVIVVLKIIITVKHFPFPFFIAFCPHFMDTVSSQISCKLVRIFKFSKL